MQIKSHLKQIYKKRDPWSHKGDFGKLLIIGGSKTYFGAPALAGLAALRSGVDLVRIAAPEKSARIIASFSPNLVVEPLEGNYVSKRHLEQLLEMTELATAVLIGSGLGRAPETESFVKSFLERIDKPCVIDADGIKALRGVRLRKNMVLTPHMGEFSILTGVKVEDNISDRIKLVKKYASKLNCTILLKGHVDIISDGTKIFLNKTGNPYMTKGGTGDVLAGVLGSLLARGIKPLQAAYAAAYISGAAGDLAAKKYRESLLATDVIEEIKNVINR